MTREHQLHTLVFSLRSCFFCASGAALRRSPNPEGTALLALFAFHVWADYVTARHRASKAGGTIRDTIDYADGRTPLWAARAFAAFSSSMQLGAVSQLLDARAPLHASRCYLILLPIQLAAFQNTLTKKGLLDVRATGALYFAELLIVARGSEWKHSLMGSAAFALRISGVLKLVIWTALALLHALTSRAAA